MILREKLRFPSGSATAQLIAVLHGTEVRKDGAGKQDTSQNGVHNRAGTSRSVTADDDEERQPLLSEPAESTRNRKDQASAEQGMTALVYSFAASAATTVRLSFSSAPK